MRRKTELRAYCCLAAFALLAAAAGCRNHMPHKAFIWPATGDIIPSHPKPPEGGYYTNWDPYAVELRVEPHEDVNPVMTQHVLVATVLDKNGKPLPNRRVEWIISEGSVGDIVEVDSSGWRASRGYKVDNKYAISHTNNFDHVLDRGDTDPSNDVHLKKGQTWIVITSPVEGTTHITAWAPGIYDWSKHKVFVKKHWYDVQWEFPPESTNPIGTTHEFVTRVSKYSDGSPLAGYEVTYRLIDGPSGSLSGGGATSMVRTDSNGEARVVLSQTTPAEGRNNLEIDIRRPANDACCEPAVHIATGYTAKTWIGPQISIAKTCTPSALVGESVNYSIVVTNPSPVDATNVVVTDNLPEGIEFVSATPSGSGQWSLGTLGAGQSQTINITGRATRVGRFTNCAEVRADHGLSDRACCDTVVTAPALVLEKTCTPSATLCDTITYTVTVRNTGDGPANNVRVVDELPAGLTSDGGNSKVFNAGTLAPGEAKQATYTARASQTGSYTNRAVATGDGGLQAEASCTTVVTNPSLSLTKSGPARQFIGRASEFTITVTNNGDAPARDTVVTDTVPAGMEFQSASDSGQFAGGNVTWGLGTLEPGASRTVTVALVGRTAGSKRNEARARAVCSEAEASFEMVIEGIPAILLEVVDLEDPIEIGKVETYVITVTNQGSAPDTNIVIKAIVQDEAEYLSADGPTVPSADGRTVVFAPLPSLAPGAKAVYRVVVRASQPGDTRFRVEMTSTELTGDPVIETEATRFY